MPPLQHYSFTAHAERTEAGATRADVETIATLTGRRGSWRATRTERSWIAPTDRCRDVSSLHAGRLRWIGDLSGIDLDVLSLEVGAKLRILVPHGTPDEVSLLHRLRASKSAALATWNALLDGAVVRGTLAEDARARIPAPFRVEVIDLRSRKHRALLIHRTR